MAFRFWWETEETTAKQQASKTAKASTTVLKRSLTRGYGSRAQEIYDNCCEWFGWDISQRGKFGSQQLLYSEGATPEGWSPWFLAHSNLSATIGGNWKNQISEDKVLEYWIEVKEGFYRDYTPRVAFAKKDKQYYFLGIYKPVSHTLQKLSAPIVDKNGRIIKKVGETVGVKQYVRVSDVYPK